MTDVLIIIALILNAVTLILSIFVFYKLKDAKNQNANNDFSLIERKIDRIGYMTEENIKNVQGFLDFSAKNQTSQLNAMHNKIDDLSRVTEQRLNDILRTLAGELKYMNEQNAKNLEQIRQTVDEKLSSTLENRLNKSYSLIHERLEAVYKGIGEVQQLASSVADIKKVFSNVKLRGTWGEVQLSSLLEQMLAPSQYKSNVHINPLDNSVVEFAILLPSQNDETVYLPIDSKFPIEEYQRLIEATESMNKDAADKAQKNLERALKLQADTIAQKYILPPLTADFAIMFLPLESLYSETLKISGLTEYFTSKRIMACGPTNFGAFLTTLQIGYKTAAIEKRSGELWELLSAFKHEFSNFVKILEKTRKKLQEAQDTIESAEKKTRTIERKLKNVAEISDSRTQLLLSDDDTPNSNFGEDNLE